MTGHTPAHTPGEDKEKKGGAPEQTPTPEKDNQKKTTQDEIHKNMTYKEVKAMEKEYENIYGKEPSPESVLAKLKQSETYAKAENYEDVQKLLLEGNKEGISESDLKKHVGSFPGQDKNLYHWLNDHVKVGKEVPKEHETPKEKIPETDSSFEKIYGEHPTQAQALKKLKERSNAYKNDKTYEEALARLEKNNPSCAARMKANVSTDIPEEVLAEKERVEDPKNQPKIEKEMEERGFEKETPAQEAKRLKEHEKDDKKEEKAKKKKEKKEKKWDLNPFNRARYTGTRILSGVFGLNSRINAKVDATLARPQDIFHRKFRGDIGRNIIRTPKAMIKSVTGAIYKPHRKKTEFEDIYKGYNDTRGPGTKKHKIIKNTARGIGKIIAPATILPKFTANLSRGLEHIVHETFEGIRDSKRHWNPRKRNLKTFPYKKTVEAFKRAFSRNRKPDVMVGESKIKTMEPKEEVKKAA